MLIVRTTSSKARFGGPFYCLEKSMGAAQKLDIYGAKGGSEKPKNAQRGP